MLVRDHDLSDARRLAVLVAHGDLALGVGPEHRFLAAVPRFGDQAQDFVAIVDRGGHQLGRVAAGMAEHDALIAGAFFLVAAAVDALGNVGRLRVQEDLDVGLVPVEAVLLVADVLDGHAGDVAHPIPGNDIGAARLAGDDDLVGRGHRLAGHPQLPGIDAGLRALAEKQIDDLVRNAIADLVWMPLRNGFAGEQVGLSRHGAPHC